jgi:serine/threonine protein kinase
MAIAYEARSPAGERVFFKQYKSPSVTVPWYEGFVRYQRDLKERIESSRAHRYCLKFVDFFEEKVGSRCYFQVFEFVESGSDLGEFLDKIQGDPSAVSWEQRLILARVMMAGISALHEAGIVHCDLKPPNIQLIRDDTITAGYVLKLIDMDFSILEDKAAPWDGEQGYVGTANYLSPEHLGSPPPRTSSDVFTCGLMLYELLAGSHPYASDDPEEYKSRVLGYRASKPSLAGSMPTPADDDAVVTVLHRCLSPSPSDRPTAKEVLEILKSKPSSRPEPPRTPAPERTSVTPPVDEGPPPLEPESVPHAEPTRSALRLVGEDGKELTLTIRTEIGKYLLRQFGDDSKFFDTLQFTVAPIAGGGWEVVPNTGATNETLLNGHAVTDAQRLNEGDVLAVGRASKGVVKLPLTIHFSGSS